MKDRLTKEESAHLISLRVPKEKATGNYSEIEMFDYPIFTLTDLLEILPKAVHKDDLAYDYNLELLWQEDMKGWLTTYDAIGDNAGSIFEIELIDALYRLLCQIIENGYLKFE